MGKVLRLTKIFLKNSFSDMNDKMGVSTKSKSRVLIYGLLFIYFAGIIIFFGYNLLDGLIEIHQESIFIGMILFMIFGLVAFQTIFSSINVLYFTKDNEYLLPLPLKPYQIILARTNVILLIEYIIVFLVGLVPLTMYGILTSASFIYYVIMTISVILIPILPVLLINIIVMFIMSFARLTKNRNRFQIIAYIIILIISVGISVSMSGTKESMSNEEMAQLIVQANGMIELIKGYIPTVDYLAEALTTNSALVSTMQILKTIVITIASFIVYLLIAQKLYFKGLVGNLFGGGAKSSNKEISQKEFRNNKLYKSYIGKEFKELARNPIFLMQCLLPSILIPILMTVIFITGINSESEETGNLTQMIQEIKIDTFVVSAVILGIIQFFTMFIYISITSISREGKNAIFIKYIPVTLYKQYIYKIIPNLIMYSITVIISLSIIQYLLHLPVLILLLIFIVSMIMGGLQSILMLIVDLKRPKLNWDSEYAVAKQNLNLIFPMLLSMINIGIIIGLVFLLNNMSAIIGLILVGVIYGILIAVANKYLYKNQEKLASNIM